MMTGAAICTADHRTAYMVRAARARRERAREVNRQYALITVAVIVTALLFSMLFGISSEASEDTNTYDHKYYTNVMISAEVNLEVLAARYADPAHYSNTREYIEEVAEINHLPVKGGTIPSATPGSKLIIPYYSEDFK